jgi:hypothetical protein
MEISEYAIRLLLHEKQLFHLPNFRGLSMGEVQALKIFTKHATYSLENVKEDYIVRMIHDYCQKKSTDDLKLILSEIDNAYQSLRAILDRELSSTSL